ncbi:MAG: class II aldolase/adducin family protein [Treponema sp.]|nr:class II aldolase/adducin family protein [Treponema sp.]
MVEEGYVKYSADHRMGEVPEAPGWKELNGARTLLYRMGLVGINSQRAGFGNLSLRFKGESFLISGTATGARPVLGPEGYCLVESFDIAGNRLVSFGPVRASSESLTHGAVYRASPGVNAVIHVHSRLLFDGMLRDHSPATPSGAAYGTPELALAVERSVSGEGKTQGILVLAGHDEGILAYGPTVETSLNLILESVKKYGTNGG